jgi:hypothetical protein
MKHPENVKPIWLIGLILMASFAPSPWGGFSVGVALVVTAIFDTGETK